MDLTDTELAQWRRGEMRGIEALYRVFGDRVYRLCVNMLGYNDAEDAAQDVFLALADKGRQFRGESSVSTFLYRVTTNHCLNQRRRQNRSRKQRPMPTDELALLQEVVTTNTPADVAILADEHRHVLRLLDRLPDDLRTILLLRESEGLPYSQIAEILAIPVGTVMSRLDRARKEVAWRIGANTDRPGTPTEDPATKPPLTTKPTT